MNFLILDDHPSLSQFISEKILKLGIDHNTTQVHTVEDAKNILLTKNIDRVICDLQILAGKNLVIPQYCFGVELPYMVFSSHVNNTLLNTLIGLNVLVYVSKGSSTGDVNLGLISLIDKKRYFCSNVNSLINSNLIEIPMPILSKAERPIIEGYFCCLTTEQIAQNLNLSITTVRNHRARVIEKNLCTFQELLDRYRFWSK